MPAWQFVGASQGINVPRSPVLLTVKITKTAATAAWDSGVSTVESFAGDGFVEFVAPDTGKSWIVGLSQRDADVGYGSVEYGAIFTAAAATFQIIESGVVKVGPTAYAALDTFRIERRGGTVNYYKNGDWIYGSVQANQAGSLRLDTAFFTQNAAPDGIRLYDATLRTWQSSFTWINAAGVLASQGTAYQRRRITVATTAKQRAGDQAVAVIAQQGGGFAAFVSSTNVTWSFVDVLSAGDHRSFLVFRRRVLEGDPASYTFDLTETQESVGGLLVYRNTDDSAALVGGDVDDIFGSTDFACPKRTPTRVTDAYVGLCWKKTQTGTMTAPRDCAARLDASPPTTYGYCTPRLFIFDFAPDGVVQTDKKHVVASVASDGVAGSMLIAGVRPPGHGLSWLPPSPGAIGLTPEGI